MLFLKRLTYVYWVVSYVFFLLAVPASLAFHRMLHHDGSTFWSVVGAVASVWVLVKAPDYIREAKKDIEREKRFDNWKP